MEFDIVSFLIGIAVCIVIGGVINKVASIIVYFISLFEAVDELKNKSKDDENKS